MELRAVSRRTEFLLDARKGFLTELPKMGQGNANTNESFVPRSVHKEIQGPLSNEEMCQG